MLGIRAGLKEEISAANAAIGKAKKRLKEEVLSFGDAPKTHTGTLCIGDMTSYIVHDPLPDE